MEIRRCQYCEVDLPWFAFLIGWWSCSHCTYRRAHGGQPMTPEGRRRIERAMVAAKRDVDQLWAAKQALAAPGRYYGEGGTIHGTTELDVETDDNGAVVAVWYRCQMLPFKQRAVTGTRAAEMEQAYRAGLPAITGVEVIDP